MQKGAVYNFYKDLPPWAKGASVLIVLGIGVVTYFSVRKWIKNRPPHVTYPNGGQGIPDGFIPENYAKKAHDTMVGIPSVEREGILSLIASLPTDDMFVAVYDTFNQLYMKEGKGTFRQWIDDEWGVSSKDALNKRFDKLNLK